MRNKLILKFWDRSKELKITNKRYKDYIKNFFKVNLKQDENKGDITTNSLISNSKKIVAKVIAKGNGIIAGIEEVSLLINGLKVKKYKKDGDKINNNDKIIEIYGDARKMLNLERTLLNILQRMSGIATETYNTKNLIKNKCQISATRKTLLHLIDKKAVSVGKGLTHRLDLSDFILIKDNHLAILGNNIKKALELANKNNITKYIEIEVKNEGEALIAAKTIQNLKSKKIFAILFDNMKPLIMKNMIKKILNELNNNNILFEASGDIRKENIEEYSKTGVDIISLGYLTHSPNALDISMEIN